MSNGNQKTPRHLWISTFHLWQNELSIELMTCIQKLTQCAQKDGINVPLFRCIYFGVTQINGWKKHEQTDHGRSVSPEYRIKWFAPSHFDQSLPMRDSNFCTLKFLIFTISLPSTGFNNWLNFTDQFNAL